jgi:PPOX class probable F420-dependent enzyme
LKLTPEQRAVFEGKNFVAVATVGSDGSPRATIAWTDVDEDGHIILDSAEGRGWPANLKRTGKVALTIYDHANPYRKVSVVGKVVEVRSEEDGGRDWINRLNRKYRGDEAGDYPVRPGERRILFKVEPETVHAMAV